MQPVILPQLRGQKGCFIHLRVLEPVNQHGISKNLLATIGLKFSNVCLGLDNEQTKLHQSFTASSQRIEKSMSRIWIVS